MVLMMLGKRRTKAVTSGLGSFELALFVRRQGELSGRVMLSWNIVF